MKVSKRERPETDKTAKNLYGFNYEVILKNEETGKKDKERFDKNSLSEYDMDKIRAII